MFNKIKNAFQSVKERITRKSNDLYFKAQNAVENAKAEFYIDKTVGIIICVVVGALLLGIVYLFVKNNIGTKLTTEINKMWGYTK